MEELIGFAVVAGVVWWWLRRRRRDAEHLGAKLRERMGYGTGDESSERDPPLVRDGRLIPWEELQGPKSTIPREALRRLDRAGLRSRASPLEQWAIWLDRPDVLIIDTETTGLGNKAEVIEVAVLDTTGAIRFLITTHAKRNLSSRSGIGGVRSAT